MIELVRPTVDLSASWWQMVDAFGDTQIHGSGYREADRARLRDPEAFEAWVDWMGAMEHRGPHVPDDYVPCSYRWIVEDGRVVGTIAVRHELNGFLLESAGHIGYAVEPGSRRRGVAGAALAQALDLAASRGLDPVLLTCDIDNVASARTIASAGGVFEDERQGRRRYWIGTHRRAAPLSMAALVTPRVALPLVTLEEAADACSGRRRPEWDEAYPRQDDVDALGRLESVGPWSSRQVVRRSDGVVVGTIGCFGEPDSNGLVEIGYGLVESARGAGLMTEVVAALANAVEASGATVMAHTDPDNTASHRVLARLGFERVGSDDGEWRWVRRSGERRGRGEASSAVRWT